MTKRLLARLNVELREIEHELKNKLPQEISRAASLGDLSENAEYEAALDRQRLLQTKFRNLKNRIGEIAKIDVSRLPTDRVGYGSIVDIFDIDEEKEIQYQLVMPEDSDAKTNRISISSPIGRALMGKKAEEEVQVDIPSGTKNYEITAVIPYCETSQDL